jgi:hypothetical protein
MTIMIQPVKRVAQPKWKKRVFPIYVGALFSAGIMIFGKAFDLAISEDQKPHVQIDATCKMNSGTFRANIFQRKDRYTAGQVDLTCTNTMGRSSRDLRIVVTLPDECKIAGASGCMDVEYQKPDGSWLSLAQFKDDWPESEHSIEFRDNTLTSGLSEQLQVIFYYDTGVTPQTPTVFAWDEESSYPTKCKQKGD